MAADQRLCGFVHRLGVQRALHMPGAAALESQRRAAIDDAIEIMAHARGMARVEIGIDGLGAEHRDRLGDEMRVQRLAQPPAVPILFKIDMGDLPAGVDAGVGAPGAMGGDRRAAESDKGRLQRLLHG